MPRIPLFAWLLAVYVAAILVLECAGMTGRTVPQRAGRHGDMTVEVADGGAPARRTMRYRVTEVASGDDYLLYVADSTCLPGDVLTLQAVRFAMSNPPDDYEVYLLRHGVRGRLYASRINRRDTTLASASWLGRQRRYALAVRRGCMARLLRAGLDETACMVAGGMLFGDKALLDDEVKADLRGAGMSHLLAVSGLHVGILLGVVMLLLFPLRWLGMERLPRLLAIVFLWAYVALTGFPPSAVRAALMLTLVLLSWIRHTPGNGWHHLCLAALVMLVYDSQQLYDVGFQLSFLATAGLLAFGPMLKRHKGEGWVWSFVRRTLVLNVAVQWFTLPVVAYYFHQVPVLGFVQGFLVVPLIPYYLVSLLVLLAFPALGWVAGAVSGMTRYVLGVAHYVTKGEEWLLGGHVQFYPSPVETMLLLAVLVAVLIVWRVLRR